MRDLCLLVVIVVVAFVLWRSDAMSMPISDATCKSYINVYCTRCHRTDRICAALQDFDRKKWKKTLKVMGKYAGLDREEIKDADACIRLFQSDASVICK